MLKKTLLTLAAALTLGTPAFAAPTIPTVAATSEGSGYQEYSALYTESSWMALELPLNLLDTGNSVMDTLSIDDSGLPAGVHIALDSVSMMGEIALLHVTVTRDDTAIAGNGMAALTVRSNGQPVATLTIPVLGAAQDE
ncbi:hypothetical protein [Deinococcus koreensis]|uniref:Uncharacterized protein n=1 Tax=Deinococcus koreensis TaxID=2054903 RepID=A0A2K3USC0_9DEIO|nr:hypothetical protein [Deinococcus koreensis]PNY79407.1 hypothetical protein CVO96_20020 [Deinococcus koreensis]